MSRLREFIGGLLNWVTLRYAVTGGFIAAFNLGVPVGLNVAFKIPIEECIPVAYVLAAMLQFTMQRLFVFRHVSQFALTMRRQAGWYVVLVAVQYPIAALATAFLPSLLGVSERIVYPVTALLVAVATFLFLRHNVFHSHPDASDTEPLRGDEAHAVIR